MKNTNEIKIAIFVMSGIFLLIFGWSYLREITIHKQKKFTVVFDNVAGLSRGSFIHINGLRVGRVDGLTLDTKGNKVLVEARIQLKDVEIPKDSKIIIRTSGYVGDKYLDIILGSSENYIAEGEVVMGEAVFDSFKSLDKLSEVVNEIDTKELGSNIQNFAKRIDTVTENTELATKNIAAASSDLSRALHQRFLIPKLWFGRVLSNGKDLDKN